MSIILTYLCPEFPLTTLLPFVHCLSSGGATRTGIHISKSFYDVKIVSERNARTGDSIVYYMAFI